MKKLFFLLFLSLFFCCGPVSGQQYHTSSKKAIKNFREALNSFQAHKDNEALEFLEKALKSDPAFVEAWMMKAQIHKDRGNAVAAIADFEKALSLDPGFYPEGYMVLAGVQFNTGDYTSARKNIRIFLDEMNFRQISREEGEQFLARADFAIQSVQNPVPFNPENLGDSINSVLNEYRPSLSLDEQRIIFTVMLPKDPSKPADMNNVQEDFFIADRNAEGNWGQRHSAGSPLNTERNEGAQSLSADGKLLYFTACDRMEGFGKCDIYYSVLKGSRWSNPYNLGSGVNSRHSDKHPSVSSDGRILYFASDRPGGFGGLDIWYSVMGLDGSWGQAVNMGENINTPGNEQSPFIHPDNLSFYFASEGHDNLGRGDVFICRRDSTGNWSRPENLGYPINTFNDEIGIIVDPGARKAYFSSNRIPGRGMDIFSFDLPEQVRPVPVSYMKGRVYDARNFRGIAADFSLTDLATGYVVMQSRSNPGEGDFMVALPTDKNYGLTVSHPSYLFYSEHFLFKGVHGQTDPFLKDVALKPLTAGESIVLNNVFFAFDSYELLDESRTELAKILELLRLNPELKIEISGHTDNTGTEAYNRVLSGKRAQAVVDYLIKSGIDPDRMTSAGYGASMPVAGNDSPEGQALNRRTEMKILGGTRF